MRLHALNRVRLTHNGCIAMSAVPCHSHSDAADAVLVYLRPPQALQQCSDNL